MAIPELNGNGLLPEGLYECTVEEVESTFGRFNQSDRRPRLYQDFKRYLDSLIKSGIGKYLIVNGSFVTAKPEPGDIDVLLVLRDDVDLSKPVPPFEYNVRSKKYIRKEFHLDFYFGFENHESSTKILDVFQQVKNNPGLIKGVLKIQL